MSEKWIVNLSTNIGTDANQFCVPDFVKKCYCFDSFEEARDKAREVIKSYAFEDNKMFDGNGHIKTFKEYIEDNIEDDTDEDFDDDLDEDEEEIDKDEEDYDDDDYCEEEYSTFEGMNKVSELFERLFDGENIILEDEVGDRLEWCSDLVILAEAIDGKALKISGEECGPCNGVDPCIYSNMFDMTTPGNYTLYIADSFDIDDYNVFSVDLMKAE